MQGGYFITGTDTNAGKTWATIALMEYLKSRGRAVAGLKPVAAGCHRVDGEWCNDDALLLQQHSNVALPYDHINPYAYPLPVSPHIAGAENPVDLDQLIQNFARAKEQADVVLVEGAGGWYSPLSNEYFNADLAKALALPVIVVVPIKLGCINQALLTIKAMLADGARCAGWVAVHNDPDVLEADRVQATLVKLLGVPLLATLPFCPEADFARLAQAFANNPSVFD
jgi:dethiobiotin synthetase